MQPSSPISFYDRDPLEFELTFFVRGASY